METFGPDALKILEIVWVNIILSGDNAVVIAMACRGLPPDKQRMGMILGAGVAIVLRIVFTLLIATLLATPYLKIAGGLLLLWVAVKLVTGEEEDESGVRVSDKLWQAVKTVAIADAVMSLDNVLAIAAVAKDSTFLLILGLAISIPLIVAGASIIISLLERFPILVWAGAALLGWIAGEMIVTDPAVVSRVGLDITHRAEIPAAIVAAIFVVGLGYLLARRRPAESRA
ncbi:TerC family protein [uncultured Enterovirga sp.]|uniref:TerC family protein n=1 Tax=uncultured Enterovirga sp. TaxID=2026352 RepID=UPI0035CB80B9